ncbi:MAG: hypothetical protein WCY59_09390 [Anaerovoracaceae bacterium]|jgi:hypothetical protein
MIEESTECGEPAQKAPRIRVKNETHGRVYTKSPDATASKGEGKSVEPLKYEPFADKLKCEKKTQKFSKSSCIPKTSVVF